MPDAVDLILQQWRGERPDLEPVLWPMELVGRVQRLNRVLERELKEFFARHDLEMWEVDVLFTLRRAGVPYTLTPGELLKAAMVTSGAMTNRIDRLAAKGLVERQPGPGDRRSVGVRLTERAKALVDGVLSDHLANEARLFATLPEADRAQLADLLRRALTALGDTSIS
jgi:DNA-binding MarR family transcriptional regulator